MAAADVPIIDVGCLLPGSDSSESSRRACEAKILAAAIEVGFFYISGHGVTEEMQQQMDETSERFFALPLAEKRRIEMKHAGTDWKGYFEVGEEYTSGIIDEKEGLYFSRELPANDPRPLHGPNQWPQNPPGMRQLVLGYMDAMESIADMLLRAIGSALGLPADHFAYREPTTLFRIMHYPPHDGAHGDDTFAVGEHTDYGYLTVLRQDNSGGLQIKADDGSWVDAPPVPNTFVVNLGDALEHNTGGLLRATPHRVQQRLGATSGRLSFPFFYDPPWSVTMRSVEPLLSEEHHELAQRRRATRPKRWDGKKLDLFGGEYGEYLLNKVSVVFPTLARETDVVEAGRKGRSMY